MGSEPPPALTPRALATPLPSWSKWVSAPPGPGTEQSNLALRKVLHLFTSTRWPPASFWGVGASQPWGPRTGPPASCSSTLTLGGRRGCQPHTLASVRLLFQVGTGLGRRVWPGFKPHCPFHSSHHADTAHSADGDTARASVRRGDRLREEEVHLVIIRVGVVRDPGGQHKPGVWEVTGKS